MAGTTYAEKEREAPASRLAELRPQAVKQEVSNAVGEQQKAAERVVGMTAQLFSKAIASDPALKGEFRKSQLNTLLEMVG